MKNSELCIPTSAVSQGAEDGTAMAPEIGDSVEVSIAGKVTRIEGGNLYVQPETANGEPIQVAGGPGMEDDEERDMDEEMARMGSGNRGMLMAALLLFALSIGASHAASLEWARTRNCSGGAVSNWVGTSIRVYNTIDLSFSNAPASGATLTMNDRTVTWTNNTPANTNHVQLGASAAISATNLLTYAGVSPFSNIVSVALTTSTNLVFRSHIRTDGVEPQVFGSSSTAAIYVLLSTNWLGAPVQVYSVEANNFSGSTLYLLIFDSPTNRLVNASPHFSAVPIPTGSVGGKAFGDAGAPFQYGVNVCLSTTPFSLTNASAGGTATIISSPRN